MPRSQWICRSCGSGFESRGKRDVHHCTQHQKLAQGGALGVQINGERRTDDGMFICQCGKRYKQVQSLNRHRRSCTASNLMERPEIEREHSVVVVDLSELVTQSYSHAVYI